MKERWADSEYRERLKRSLKVPHKFAHRKKNRGKLRK